MKNNFLYKLCLLLIALPGYIGVGLISPIMADLAANFPNAAQTQISLIVTIPTLLIVPGLFVSAYLTTKVRRKTIVCSCLFVLAACGVAPYFLNSIVLIILSRAVMGFVMGILMPIQSTYFAEFETNLRTKMFGINSVVNGLLGAAFFALIGILSLSWRSVFLLYGIFAVVFVLAIITLPKGTVLKIEKADTTKNEQKGNSPLLQKTFIFSCVTVLIVMASYLIVPTTISFYLADHQLGGAAEAGILSSISTICLALGGFVYPILRGKFKNQTATVCLGIFIVGLLIYAFPKNIVLLGIGFVTIGLGSSFASTDFTMQVTEMFPLAYVAVASSILNCFIFGGQFLATYFQSTVTAFWGLSVEGSYIVFAVLAFGLMIINNVIQK